MSAKQQYEEFLKEIKKRADEFNVALAKFLLSSPIPMSYEVWTYLHSFIDGDDFNGR